MKNYYFRIVRILTLSLIIFLSTANPLSADGGPHEEVNKVDGYRVKLTFVEGNAQVGLNKLKIEIKDVLDKPVSNATVTVIAELYPEKANSTSSSGSTGMNMDGMAGHSTATRAPPVVQAPTQTITSEMIAGSEPGKYEGTVELNTAGHWMIQVDFLILSRERVAEFPMDVYGAPNNSGILGAFLGVNVVIIGVAAFTRKNRRKKPVLEMEL